MLKILPFLFILSLWFITFYQGLSTAISVWSISEIFTHCFLVIPGAFYLIFQKRKALSQQVFIPNYWLLIPLFTLLVLQTFGAVGDIRLFMHIATFASLPLLIWMIIGNRAAKIIVFPLYFILFSIPFGEVLIPFLQDLTTDLAVPLIQLSGVPIYRNGLYLDIPEGRFLVAEACSGISFLIASVVFGNLYAYLSFKKFYKQLIFVVISILVPILANAIRVYGIVLTGHLSDMEYAVGADHLIYGGVFYGIIIFLLIVIGEKFRDKKSLEVNQSANSESFMVANESAGYITIVVAVLFTMQFVWLTHIENQALSRASKGTLLQLTHSNLVIKNQPLVTWQPHFVSASHIQQGVIEEKSSSNKVMSFYIANYIGGEGELISSLNKLYNPERWALIHTEAIVIDSSFTMNFTELVSPTGTTQHIVSWYQIGQQNFVSRVKAKLFQTAYLLMGNQNNSRFIAFAIESKHKQISSKKQLIDFIEANYIRINQELANG